MYTLRYVDYLGNQVESVPKVWINDFLVDKETMLGKTDLGLSIKVELEEGPTVGFRDWVSQDVFVELHHSRPMV